MYKGSHRQVNVRSAHLPTLVAARGWEEERCVDRVTEWQWANQQSDLS
jgi:hypothetical protein